MQNRLVITGIPPSVPRLANARDSLRDFIEDHACWVDRFVFLSVENASLKGEEDGATMLCAAAAELHIENVRDRAVKSLDGMVVCMDREGVILADADSHSDHDSSDSEANQKCNAMHDVSFRIQSRPANAAESAELVRKCPIESDDVAAEKRMEKQALRLPPLGIELTVRRSEEHGGTGTYPWRGGLMLSRQICHWASAAESVSSGIGGVDSDCKTVGNIDFRSLFCNKMVLELGAGAAGLPSMTLGKISKSLGHQMELVSSDGVDEIVNSLKANISDNGLGDTIHVKHIDWNEYANDIGKDAAKADTIIFADCIYNEECALALSQTLFNLLKPGGSIIGVLPDFRVGLDLFQERMRENSFIPRNIPIIAMDKNDGKFACSGGGGKDYRFVLWRDGRNAA